MLAVGAGIAFVVCFILHIMKLDPFVTTAFFYAGMALFAFHVVYPWTPFARRIYPGGPR